MRISLTERVDRCDPSRQ